MAFCVWEDGADFFAGFCIDGTAADANRGRFPPVASRSVERTTFALWPWLCFDSAIFFSAA